MAEPTHRPDPIETWKALQERSFLYRGVRRDREESYWSRYAANYEGRRSCGEGVRREVEIVADLLGPSTTVLEIGAGTGAFTLPISRMAAQVTAVDPSPSMMCILREKLFSEGITNVEIVQAPWEEVEVPVHDVVLAAGCSYVFYDIRSALTKMIEKCRRALVLTAGDDGYARIYEACAQVMGVPKPCAGPGYIHLYNVLHKMGIHADIRIVRSHWHFTFDSVEHAVETWADRLGVPPRDLSRLRAYLEERLRPIAGGWGLAPIETIGAVIIYRKPVDATGHQAT